MPFVASSVLAPFVVMPGATSSICSSVLLLVDADFVAVKA